MREYPKRIERLIGEWLAEAHERELHRELTRLDQSFAEWRAGAIGSGELSHRIHQWEAGPSRALFKHYNQGPQDLSVACAIVIGVLNETELPPELLAALAGPIDFYRALQERDELQHREGNWWRR